MRFSSPPILRKHAVIAVLLVMTLLLAQWSGLAHRIYHAHTSAHQMSAVTAAQDGAPGDSLPYHSCVAFDAAAVADVIHIDPFVPRAVDTLQIPALPAAFSSWDASLLRHFSSRAPPFA